MFFWILRRKKMEDSFDWYALSDSGNIKVDKEGNGLMALWIDQLMQFNNVGIDTAQAIARRYPSPRSLMQVTFTRMSFGLNVALTCLLITLKMCNIGL